MLLPYVIIALVTVGFVLPCVLDIATTPRHYFDLPTKRTWLIVAVAFWAFGAAAWLLIGRRDVRVQRLWDDVTGSWSGPEREARFPVVRATGADYRFGPVQRERQAATVPVRFIAPDDNPDFLLELDRRIRDWREGA